MLFKLSLNNQTVRSAGTLLALYRTQFHSNWQASVYVFLLIVLMGATASAAKAQDFGISGFAVGDETFWYSYNYSDGGGYLTDQFYSNYGNWASLYGNSQDYATLSGWSSSMSSSLNGFITDGSLYINNSNRTSPYGSGSFSSTNGEYFSFISGSDSYSFVSPGVVQAYHYDNYQGNYGDTLTMYYPPSGVPTVSGSFSGYYINGTLYASYNYSMSISSPDPDSTSYSLFGSNYQFQNGGVSYGLDSSDNLISYFSDNYTNTTSGTGSFTISWTFQAAGSTGTFSGFDPVAGNFAGTVSSTGGLTLSPRPSPSFASSQVWINGKALNFQYGTLDIYGNVADIYQGGDYTLTITDNLFNYPSDGGATVTITGPESGTGNYVTGTFFSISNEDLSVQTTQNYSPNSAPTFADAQLYINGMPYAFFWGVSDSSGNTVDIYYSASGPGYMTLTGNSGTPGSATVYVNFNDGLVYTGNFSGGFSVNNLDVGTTQQSPLFGPPGIWVQGESLPFAFYDKNSSVYYDQYLAANGPDGVSYYDPSQTSTPISIVCPSLSAYGNGTFAANIFQIANLDVRALSGSGSLLLPNYAPTSGPAGFYVDGSIWQFLGTASLGDLYAGSQPGQLLWLNGTSVQLTDPLAILANAIGTYSGGPAAISVSDHSEDILPLDSNGLASPAVFGPAGVLVNGTVFNYIGTSSGWDNYASSMNPAQAVAVSNGSTGGPVGVVFAIGLTGTYGNDFFQVSGANLEAIDANGNVILPGVWIEGDTYTYAGILPGGRSYSDSAGNSLSVTASGGGLLISGVFNSASFTGNVSQSLPLFNVSPGSGTTWAAYPTHADGTILYSSTITPLSGLPPAVMVQGSAWPCVGVALDDSNPASSPPQAVYYSPVGSAGLGVNELLKIESSGLVTFTNYATGLSVTGSYIDGVFQNNGSGTGLPMPMYGVDPNNGNAPWPSVPSGVAPTLLDGGSVYRYAGTAGNGVQTYLGPASGQYITLSPGNNGSYTVSVVDPINGNASGTSQQGVFTVAGAQIQTGDGAGDPSSAIQNTNQDIFTISSNLDILGNMLNLGSWNNDPNTAGLTINYTDSPTASPASATISFGASRSASSWLWSQASSPMSTVGTPQMMLDSQNRILLYNPANPGQPAIIFDPSMATTSLHVPQMGDLLMGEFTQSPGQ